MVGEDQLLADEPRYLLQKELFEHVAQALDRGWRCALQQEHDHGQRHHCALFARASSPRRTLLGRVADLRLELQVDVEGRPIQ